MTKLISLEQLTKILVQFQQRFGLRSQAELHKNYIDAYLLNIDYSIFDEDVSVSKLGQGKVGFMILGEPAQEEN